MDMQAEKCFDLLNDKRIVEIRISKIDMYQNEEYIIKNEKRIIEIKEKLSNIDGQFTTSNQFILDESSRYFLKFADDQNPPHFTDVFISGGRVLEIINYNYSKNKYDRYTQKIKWDVDEINNLLKKEK